MNTKRVLCFLVVLCVVLLALLLAVPHTRKNISESFAINDMKATIVKDRCDVLTKDNVFNVFVKGMVDTSRIKSYRPKPPTTKRNQQMEYCSIDNDPGLNLQDPLMPTTDFSSMCEKLQNGNPMIPSSVVQQVTSLENKVGYDRCVLEINPDLVTSSNINKLGAVISRYHACSSDRYRYISGSNELVRLQGAYIDYLLQAHSNESRLITSNNMLQRQARRDYAVAIDLEKKIKELEAQLAAMAKANHVKQSELNAGIAVWQQTLDATRCNIDTIANAYEKCRDSEITEDMIATASNDVYQQTLNLQAAVNRCEQNIEGSLIGGNMDCQTLQSYDPTLSGILANWQCTNTCDLNVTGSYAGQTKQYASITTSNGPVGKYISPTGNQPEFIEDILDQYPTSLTFNMTSAPKA